MHSMVNILRPAGRLFALVSLLIALSPTVACSDGGQGGSDAGPAGPLSVATFNVQNYFDAEDDPFKLDDTPSPAEVRAKTHLIGRALRLLDADVVALQEVENKKILQKLVDDELSDEGYREVRLVEGNDPRGIDVALLSRRTVRSVKSHKDDRFGGSDGRTHAFSRDCLEVALDAAASRTLVLLVNHLKASRSSDGPKAAQRRLAQAHRVREIAAGLMAEQADRWVAVVGDLNDTPASEPLRALTDADPPLEDVLRDVSGSARNTVGFGGGKQFDYILMSPALHGALVAGSAKVDRRSAFDDASDHFPVRAEFRLK